MKWTAAGIGLLVAASSPATDSTGPARVLKDINVGAGVETFAWPQGFVELPEVTVFIADDGVHGLELWRTDGTEAGTVLVKDIRPGPAASVFGRSNSTFDTFVSVRLGDFAYFPATDGVHGLELWRTDGTEAGTFLVKDVRPGLESGLDPASRRLPFTFAAAGGLLYFLADDSAHGMELWRSDGTEAGTFMLRDISPGGSDSNSFGSLAASAAGGMLFFTAFDSVHGSELWRSDGTESGTIRLTDMPIGGGIGRFFAGVGDVLLFSAGETASDFELWRSDGTEAGTYRVKDIRPGPETSDLQMRLEMGGELYFTADDGEHGRELWKSDGTESGTVLVKDIRDGAPSSVTSIDFAFGGKLYFVADDGTHGREMWVTDGTGAGTHLVKDIVPGSGAPSELGGFTPVGTRLYFVLNDGVHGPEVWTTDGTDAGTSLVTDLLANFGPWYLIGAGERLFYVRGETARGVEPWGTNGSDGGIPLGDIYPGPRSSFSFLDPGTRGDTVLFGADDGVHGIELWATDASPSGTHLLKNINMLMRTAPSTEMVGAVDLGGTLLFFADDGLHGQEPWITDGTEEGTRIVRDVFPGLTGSLGSAAGSPARVGSSGRAVFSAFESDHGQEIWATDGTDAGTYLVKDIRPGTASSAPRGLTTLDSVAVFFADDGLSGRELWVTDGTDVGTHLVEDLNPGPASSAPDPFVRFGDALYFFVLDGSSRRNLWRTDGTEAGTYLVSDLGYGYRPGVYEDAFWYVIGSGLDDASRLMKTDGTPGGDVEVAALPIREGYELTAAGDLLFFVGYSDATGAELWVTDGTAAGTHLVKDIFPGEDGNVTDLTAVGDTLFFVAAHPEYGLDVWKSDGTEAGTVLVKDIGSGDPFDTTAENLTNVEGILLFKADDGEHGRELWRSDGTEAGTFPVADFLPGPEGSNPGPIVSFGNRVAFAATDDAAGREPWIARPSILTRQPLRAVQDLAAEVRALGLPQGIETSLTAKLGAVLNALSRPDGKRTALRLLDTFGREVERRTPDPIPPASAAELLDFVAEIASLLDNDAGAPL